MPLYLHNPIPSGVMTDELTEIGCTLTGNGALLVASLDMVATGPTGQVLTAISGGAIQSGWGGDIFYDATPAAWWIQIRLTSWPDEIAVGARWSFTVDATDLMDP